MFIAVFLEPRAAPLPTPEKLKYIRRNSHDRVAESDSVNWNDWYLECRPARRCTHGNVDDAVEELEELGVAEIDLEVDFVVELDVMLAEEGSCASPINASALILLGRSRLNCPVSWGMSSPVASIKSRTSFEAWCMCLLRKRRGRMQHVRLGGSCRTDVSEEKSRKE